MAKEKQEKINIWRNQILQNSQDITPLKFKMSQDEVMDIFGEPDDVSTIKYNARR